MSLILKGFYNYVIIETIFFSNNQDVLTSTPIYAALVVKLILGFLAPNLFFLTRALKLHFVLVKSKLGALLFQHFLRAE
jgi:hypothetical protein